MRYRIHIMLFGVLIFQACTGTSPQQQAHTEAPLNFLIIIDDQHNNKHMGWTGYGDGVKTPALDRLASQSIAFTSGYTNNPVCAPSRHTMLTGLYSAEHGVIQNDLELTENVPTLMAMLSEAGYMTADIGKMHHSPYHRRYGFQYVLNHEFYQNNAGISHYYTFLVDQLRQLGIERYDWNTAEPRSDWAVFPNTLAFRTNVPYDLASEHWVTDEAINFLKDQMENRSDQPFLLHASYFAPHHPYGPSPKFDTYQPEDMALPPNWDGQAWDNYGKGKRAKQKLPGMTADEYKHIKAKYFGFISQLDYEVGRLIDYVDSQPKLADNTVIIFVSDHGDRMGEHGQIFKGGNGAMLEGAAGIPFIIRWPGITARKESTPVSMLDITPTLLAAAGLNEKSSILQGNDLKPLMQTSFPEIKWSKRTVFSDWFQGRAQFIMARKGDYKVIAGQEGFWWKRNPEPKFSYQLFNLKKDVWEMNDLVNDPAHQEILTEMKREILAHYQEQLPHLPASMPPVVPRNRYDVSQPFDPWTALQPLP